jgi:hypothetical protein
MEVRLRLQLAHTNRQANLLLTGLPRGRVIRPARVE